MAWTPFRNVMSSAAPRNKDLEGKSSRSMEGEAFALPKASVPDLLGSGQKNGSHNDRRSGALDLIGQRDERLRQRIDLMADRLEDLRNIQDDFNLILEPLVDISGDLSKASVRVSELESALQQESRTCAALRSEAAEAANKLSYMSAELSDLQAQAQQMSERLRERDATVEAQKIDLRDRMLALENLERQHFAEVEQNKALVAENRALRHEAQSADSALARSEHELSGAREKIGVSEAENRRLELLSEELAVQLGGLQARHNELEVETEADKQRLRAVESQLAAEISLRERIEAQHEADAASFKSERTSLTMKLEAAVNRIASNDHMILQVRNQLREKDEEFRSSDRNLKEAVIARNTADRRLEALQADLARQSERFLEIQRIRGDLDSRCDMLNKAIVAKDAAIEQLSNKNTALNDRIEHLIHRQEAARSDFEATNRKLMEELHNERSERSLLQGALDIARESRINLQKQHDAFKRSGRPWRELVADESADEGAMMADEQQASNVRPFTPGTKSN